MTKHLSTPRVQRFRERMGGNGYVRFEAVIDADAVLKLRRLSKETDTPVWELLEAAINRLEGASGNAVKAETTA